MAILDSLSDYLNLRLIGQKEAVQEFATTIALTINRRKVGRTKGLVFMAGPTGTGKTEMVELAARFLFGEAVTKHYARLDMAEYQHVDSINRLLGAPGEPGVLGQVITSLNRAAGERGTAFLLLDEIEKAHADIVTVLLAFDSARVTTSDGVTHDLSRLWVIVTSNVGSSKASEMQHSPYTALRDEVLLQAAKRFRPETIARFDARIVMNRLDYAAQREITRRFLTKEITEQQNRLCRLIQTSDGVINFLIRVGFSERYGARNLRSAVERQVGMALLPWDNRDDDDDAPDRYSRMLLIKEDKLAHCLVAVRLADEERAAKLRAILMPEQPAAALIA